MIISDQFDGSSNKRILQTISNLITDPGGFFDARASTLRLRSAAAIIAVYALLQAVAVFVLYSVLLRGYSLPLQSLGLLSLLAVELAAWSVGWLAYTAVLYLLSYLFGGSGSFRQTLTLVGWGFLPLIIGPVLATIVNLVTVANTPAIPLRSSAQAIRVVLQLGGGPANQAVNLVSSVLFFWSGYIWVFALKCARGLSLRQASIIVAVPVLLSVGVSLLA